MLNNIHNSSINIKSMISLMVIHEHNINQILRQTQDNTTFERELLSMINLHRNTQEPPRSTHLIDCILQNNELFLKCKYNELMEPLNTVCPISMEEFTNDDDVVVLKKCEHIVKKQLFIRLLEQSSICPCCRTDFLII